MDNQTRSERTRDAALQAALTIIARDGAAKLTLDAIARESGISKGGLMYQFRSKEAVLTALLERQTAEVAALSRRYVAEHGAGQLYPELAARIATSRAAITGPAYAVSYAIFGLLAQDPGLLAVSRAKDVESVAVIKAEATDPDLAMLRWLAARGLTQTALIGPSPLTAAERDRLFARLLDDKQWAKFENPGTMPVVPPKKSPARSTKNGANRAVNKRPKTAA
jgi:AcrR family transcriptional regulator